MTLSQRTAIHTLLAGTRLDLGGDVVEQRAVLHHLLTAHPAPDDVLVAPTTLEGVPALSITIESVPVEGTMLYLHGGVFAMGSAQASIGLAADLARRTKLRASPSTTASPPNIPGPQLPTTRCRPTGACWPRPMTVPRSL